jgi:EAL domain-containing protein (putative c-di-GMP-specific phosphodiesterase class I)
VLKIDQSFVRGLGENSQDARLISAIISLGKSLDLNIIAEGVETLEQLEFLKPITVKKVRVSCSAKPCLPMTSPN